MEIEQPQLGSVGVDTFTITCAWAWESGWSVTTSYRLSGSEAHQQRRVSGLSASEAFAYVEDLASDYFGSLD